MSAVVRNREKLKTLIHYVAYRCAMEPSVLGAVKLNKVLWYSDLTAYLTWGMPITGEKYIKKALGPVASSLMPLVEELETEKALAIRRLPALGDKVEYLALTKPEVSKLTAEEIAVIEDQIQTVCHKHSAKSISTKSHDVIWRLAELDEEIPYFAMLTSRLHEITADDMMWAREQLAANAAA